MPLCKIHEEKTVNGIFYEGKWKLGTLNCRREHFVKAKGLIILVSSCLAAFELYRKFRDVCNCSSTIPYSHRCELPRVKMQRIVLVTKSTGDCIDICDKLSQCRKYKPQLGSFSLWIKQSRCPYCSPKSYYF